MGNEVGGASALNEEVERIIIFNKEVGVRGVEGDASDMHCFFNEIL